ncbi:MAG: hypothetical protein D6701_13645 [Gemmatimonadetes bacterium]|nr:MAG: hypothetical protein D6701_13645 [Gemmatimonadota bacterium]
MSRLTSLLAAVPLLAACSSNAILELELTLPAAPDPSEPLYAFVQMRTNTNFDTPWSGAVPFDGIPLQDVPSEHLISVVAEPGQYDDDLFVRVSFCHTPRCDGFGDDFAPERRLRIEHPFYELKRTRASWVIDAVPTETVETPDVIERCAVEGCREGTTRDFCRMSDGSHFCE